VVLDNEVYKVAAAGSSKSPAPAAAPVSSGPYELENNAAVLSALGFPTAEGTYGFTPFVEVLHGRLAMAGIVGSVARELNTDMGTLEQLGVEGLPSIGGYWLMDSCTQSSTRWYCLCLLKEHAYGMLVTQNNYRLLQQ
jgi:hypothetical protein